jgi:hypothetical protein
MQSTPAGDERRVEAPEPAGPVAREDAAAGAAPVSAVPVRGTPVPRRSHHRAPTLVLRPQIGWRAVGPILILLAFAALAVGRRQAVPAAFLLGVLGAAFLPAWLDRVDVGETTIIRRSLRGRRTIVIDEVDTMRLRRVPFVLLRFLPRGYKVGRYWSIPLTLRLLDDDHELLALRCIWWDNWRGLSRYLVSAVPEVDLDGRTRGRLERYVGMLLPTSSHR